LALQVLLGLLLLQVCWVRECDIFGVCGVVVVLVLVFGGCDGMYTCMIGCSGEGGCRWIECRLASRGRSFGTRNDLLGLGRKYGKK
jgi:hypothetical protein